MTFVKPIAAAAALAFLTACGTPDSISVQSPAISETMRIGFRSVEVKDVSLPGYAAADEILARLTRARIASEPWPFEEEAAATLDVRFADLVAGTDGVFRATGQYFVGVFGGRERSGLFDLTVPYDADGGPTAIARARGQIILDLAKFIAQDGLR